MPGVIRRTVFGHTFVFSAKDERWLPLEFSAETTGDVEVRLVGSAPRPAVPPLAHRHGVASAWLGEDGWTDAIFQAGPDDGFTWARVAPAGDVVEIRWRQGWEEPWARAPWISIDGTFRLFEGPLGGIVLNARGVGSLHGCAFEAAGHGFVVMGDSGAGKSTLAAALHVAGAAVGGDELTPVTRDRRLLAGPGQARIDEAAARALGLRWDELRPPWSHPLVASNVGDPRRCLPTRLFEAPVSLAAVFLLETPRAPALEVREARVTASLLGRLGRNWVGFPGLGPLSPLTFVRELLQHVPVFEVRLPQGVARLPEAAHDLAALGVRAAAVAG